MSINRASSRPQRDPVEGDALEDQAKKYLARLSVTMKSSAGVSYFPYTMQIDTGERSSVVIESEFNSADPGFNPLVGAG